VGINRTVTIPVLLKPQAFWICCDFCGCGCFSDLSFRAQGANDKPEKQEQQQKQSRL
jgi:hypothetical protein